MVALDMKDPGNNNSAWRKINLAMGYSLSETLTLIVVVIIPWEIYTVEIYHIFI